MIRMGAAGVFRRVYGLAPDQLAVKTCYKQVPAPVTSQVARSMSAFTLAAPVGAARSQAIHPKTGRLVNRAVQRCSPARSTSGSGGGGEGTGGEDAGAAFVQRFQSISADLLANAKAIDGVKDESAGGCCGGSGGDGASAQAATSSVSQQLNSMMSGMEGSLTREDLKAAFDARPRSASGGGDEEGERFLDVAAILRGEGGGEAQDDDAELDALVV